jgi:predicted amidohydrolase
MLAVPAAFTYATGKAHWHVLARARAIETGSFVLAPNQCGTHAEGRKTWGHSLIINPWGEILADGGEEVGIVTATIDLDQVAEARRKIPALKHDRTFPALTRPVLQSKAGE